MNYVFTDYVSFLFILLFVSFHDYFWKYFSICFQKYTLGIKYASYSLVMEYTYCDNIVVAFISIFKIRNFLNL